MKKDQQEFSSSRRNNFNLVRLMGALLVMFGHMGPIMGAVSPVMGEGLHGIGVEILFLVGGYLIAESWLHDPHPLRYSIRRFLRLWPPYAVMVLLMTFVAGPLLSDLGSKGYFGSWWKEFLKNLRFYIVYAQPGVFTDQPMPYVTNGSLWTMPVEAALYVVTPIILYLFGVQKKKKYAFPAYLVFLLVVIGIGTWVDNNTEVHWIFYATDWAAAFRLSVYFFIGIFCSFEPVKKCFHIQWSFLAWLCIILVLYEARPVQYLVLSVALPYLVFSLALAPSPVFWCLGTKYEISYGIYLYGFFFQQLVVYWQKQNGLSLSVPVTLLVSMLLTLPVSWLSCVLVENPLKVLGRRLFSAMRSK
ncbi:MAG: acyltransferase [Clostridia bacterium]|nr:acyltransferase [Clostridia bacterium]